MHKLHSYNLLQQCCYSVGVYARYVVCYLLAVWLWLSTDEVITFLSSVRPHIFNIILGRKGAEKNGDFIVIDSIRTCRSRTKFGVADPRLLWSPTAPPATSVRFHKYRPSPPLNPATARHWALGPVAESGPLAVDWNCKLVLAKDKLIVS